MRLEGIFIFSCQCGNFIKTTSTPHTIHCPKSNLNFRDITPHVEENEIQHKIFRIVSRFLRVISRKIDYLWDSVYITHCTTLLQHTLWAHSGSVGRQSGNFPFTFPTLRGAIATSCSCYTVLYYTYQQSSQSELFWVFIILVLFKGSSCK